MQKNMGRFQPSPQEISNQPADVQTNQTNPPPQTTTTTSTVSFTTTITDSLPTGHYEPPHVTTVPPPDDDETESTPPDSFPPRQRAPPAKDDGVVDSLPMADEKHTAPPSPPPKEDDDDIDSVEAVSFAPQSRNTHQKTNQAATNVISTPFQHTPPLKDDDVVDSLPTTGGKHLPPPPKEDDDDIGSVEAVSFPPESRNTHQKTNQAGTIGHVNMGHPGGSAMRQGSINYNANNNNGYSPNVVYGGGEGMVLERPGAAIPVGVQVVGHAGGTNGHVVPYMGHPGRSSMRQGSINYNANNNNNNNGYNPNVVNGGGPVVLVGPGAAMPVGVQVVRRQGSTGSEHLVNFVGNPWSSGIFDCFQHPTNAIITCFAPCATFGQIAEVVDNGSTSCLTGAMLYVSLFLVLCHWNIGIRYRRRLRTAFDLSETPVTDRIAHVMFPLCALCQEFRELNSRGLNPFLGYQGIVAQREQDRLQQLVGMQNAPAIQNMAR